MTTEYKGIWRQNANGVIPCFQQEKYNDDFDDEEVSRGESFIPTCLFPQKTA